MYSLGFQSVCKTETTTVEAQKYRESQHYLALVRFPTFWGLLGVSWVVISRVISPLIGVILIVTLLMTPLIATHEPPSTVHAGVGQLKPRVPALG